MLKLMFKRSGVCKCEWKECVGVIQSHTYKGVIVRTALNELPLIVKVRWMYLNGGDESSVGSSVMLWSGDTHNEVL